MEFHIGTPVLAEDGRAGTLERLIFDPARDEIHGLVVHIGSLPSRDVVVPADRVLSADSERVWVRGTVDEIAAMEGFTLSQFSAPPEDWLPPANLSTLAPNLLFPASPVAVGAFVPPSPVIPPPETADENKPPGSVDLSAVTEVACTDGPAGTVDRVLTEGDSDVVTHLIVRRGTLLPRDIAVPADTIGRTDEHTVYLTLTLAELDRLPEFRE